MFFSIFPILFIKKAHVKMKAKTDTDKHHERELSSGNEDRISLNGKCNLIFSLPEVST